MHSHSKHTIHRDHGHYGWNNAFPPRLTIAPGETVHFETKDPSSGQLTPASTTADIAKLDFSLINPVTGPVFIDGAQPGDALKVKVLSFAPSGWGWTGNIPGFGLLADQFPDPKLHIWKYDTSLLTPAMDEAEVSKVCWDHPLAFLKGPVTALSDPRIISLLLLATVAVCYYLLR